MAKDISLEGLNELLKQFNDIAHLPDASKMEAKLISRARELRNLIRTRTPRGKYGKYGRYSIKRTKSGDMLSSFTKAGNLRRSIEARRFRTKVKGSPAVYVRVNKRIAPHYHLIEFGTENFRYPKSAKVLHFDYGGEEIFAKWVGPISPKPFFRPTVDKESQSMIDKISHDVSQLIEDVSESKLSFSSNSDSGDNQ